MQVIASWSELKGLSFFRYRLVGYVFGVLVIVAAFCWFFITDRHVAPHPMAKMGEQLAASIIGAGVAIVLTLVISSFIKFRTFEGGEGCIEGEKGLDTLRKKTFFQAVRDGLQRGTEEE